MNTFLFLIKKPATLLSIQIGVLLAPIFHLFEKYCFSDWEFLRFVGVLIVMDTALGFWKAWKYGKVSSKGFSLLFHKALLYSLFLIMSHVCFHYTTHGEQNTFFAWFDDLAYASIVIRECISLMENMGAIYPAIIPKWVLKKFKDFDENGDFNSIQI